MNYTNKMRKGVSEILGSLIVLVIVLAIGVPLVLYANSLNSANSNAIGGSFQKATSALSTQFTIFQLNNTAKETFLYNYGQTPIQISQIIINNVSYSIQFTLKPNQLVSLADISSQIPNNLTRVTILIQANGNYYTI